MTLRFTTAPIQDLGSGPHGTRVTYPITGGSFEGERLRGRVLAGGDDWTLRDPHGVVELDGRATIETDDGALIHLAFEGLRAGAYFRTVTRFETAARRYAFLNTIYAIGGGEVTSGGPVHVLEELL